MASIYSEPSPRWGHFSVAVEGQAYVCRGCTNDFTTVHVFNPCQESWQEREPKGTPPPGLLFGAYTSIGHHAYYYGGVDETEKEHGVLHQLNTSTLNWTELLTSAGPMKKDSCGMISFDNQLLLFGGHGVPSGPTQPGAEFVEDPRLTDGSGWTNELHTFCLKEGESV